MRKVRLEYPARCYVFSFGLLLFVSKKTLRYEGGLPHPVHGMKASLAHAPENQIAPFMPSAAEGAFRTGQ